MFITEAMHNGSGKISIALDAWTSPNKLTFLASEAYFIDKDWKLRSMLIGFEQLHEAHTGENMASVTLRCLEEFSIHDSLFALVSDNASNNQTLGYHLALSLDSREKRIRWDQTSMQIPCMAHVIQLVVVSFLDAIKCTAKNDDFARSVGEEGIARTHYIPRGFQRTLYKVREARLYYFFHWNLKSCLYGNYIFCVS